MHRVTPEKISAEKEKFAAVLDVLPQPRVAVLIGGNSRAHKMTPYVAGMLGGMLHKLNASLMITCSRRTGVDNERMLRATLSGPKTYFWDGTGESPYFALLGFADYIIVTEDSVSMASEALSTGKPVYIAPLEGGGRRLDRFHKLLQEQGYTRPFMGLLEEWSYTPPHDTMKAADEIRRRLNIKE
jgi:mitochondrial fission protein ELM1